MIKKKAKKGTTKKIAKKKSTARKEKTLNPAEVRRDISQMVEAEARDMAQAVIDEGKKGQLATVKYLFEVASIHPLATDGSQATPEEESLAATLLRRLNLPEEPIGRDEDEEDTMHSIDSGAKESVEADEDEVKGGLAGDLGLVSGLARSTTGKSQNRFTTEDTEGTEGESVSSTS